MITRRILNRLGIHLSSLGHQYIVYAVALVRDDSSLLHSVTSALYPAIANRFCVSPASVEQSIRYCLNHCWQMGNRALLNEIAGYPLQYRPYTRDFIAMLADYVCREEAESSGILA